MLSLEKPSFSESSFTPEQGDAPTTATIGRFTAILGCSCWLLFAVIPPPCNQESKDLRGVCQSFADFSLRISENSDQLGLERRAALTLQGRVDHVAAPSHIPAHSGQP